MALSMKQLKAEIETLEKKHDALATKVSEQEKAAGKPPQSVQAQILDLAGKIFLKGSAAAFLLTVIGGIAGYFWYSDRIRSAILAEVNEQIRYDDVLAAILREHRQEQAKKRHGSLYREITSFVDNKIEDKSINLEDHLHRLKFDSKIFNDKVAVTFSQNFRIEYSTKRESIETIYFLAAPHTQPRLICKLKAKNYNNQYMNNESINKYTPRLIKFVLNGRDDILKPFEVGFREQFQVTYDQKIDLTAYQKAADAKLSKAQIFEITIKVGKVDKPDKQDLRFASDLDAAIEATNRSFLKGNCFVAVIGRMASTDLD